MPFRSDFTDADWEEIRQRQLKRFALAAAWIAVTGMRAGTRVLDIGSGPGVFTLEYAQAVGPSGRVYALEKESGALLVLRAALGERSLDNVTLVEGDGEERIDVDEDVDVVMLTDVLHHAGDPAALLGNVKGAMGRGTLLLVAEYDPAAPGEFGPPLEKRLPAEDLRHMLERAGLRITGGGSQPQEHYFLTAARID